MIADNSKLSQGPTPYNTNDRDFGHFSDHVTVWIDKYIGMENSYADFKAKFDNNIQVLQSNNLSEMEIDDDSILCENPDMLKKLSDEVYCLKYFSTIEKGLEYIVKNFEKKIFFISSGTIGKVIVPQIVNLSQIQGIYIFCGDISRHTEWAGEYADKISAMLEHQDNLLERLTRDISIYIEKKGDEYKANQAILQARNCYSWSKKLLIRGKQLGDSGSTKLIDNITKKINETQSSEECHNEN
ncbi:unnamed protein product [Rotaria sp. Silwood2]|nr:unnamed protein product [Rotaria sp. Silwood2]CAF3306174.1 unnamed protein product [Rotaria sp. Silwood2]CAF4191491.1 unnamed protein product [Rotaria sp. Silwood2]